MVEPTIAATPLTALSSPVRQINHELSINFEPHGRKRVAARSHGEDYYG